MENSKDDIVANTLDVIEIISTQLKDFKGFTGHDDCDECSHDCIHKALDIVKIITDKYTFVAK